MTIEKLRRYCYALLGRAGRAVKTTAPFVEPRGTDDLIAMQNYATYPSMPGALRALCPVRRGVTPGIRPYARCHFTVGSYYRRVSMVDCVIFPLLY